MKKYCTRCGKQFEAVGREVICPDCKAQAAEETKKAAVLRAKRASWAGESVPVRISGRASTVIRRYGAEHNLPFAESLDALLKASEFFQSAGKAWEDITPYKSHRRDKNTATATAQDVPQEVKAAQDVSQAHDGTQTAKAAKTSLSKAAANTASKASKASKASTSKK